MTTPATDEEIAELEGLLEKATPRPWKRDDNLGCKSIKGGKATPMRQSRYRQFATTDGINEEVEDAANADLIVNAANLLPALLARLHAAEAEAKMLEQQWDDAIQSLKEAEQEAEAHQLKSAVETLRKNADLASAEQAEARIRAEERERLMGLAKSATVVLGDRGVITIGFETSTVSGDVIPLSAGEVIPLSEWIAAQGDPNANK